MMWTELKMAVFWVVVLCIVVEFTDTVEVFAAFVWLILLAAGISEMSVHLYLYYTLPQAEDSHLPTHHCENLKSHMV
jgi:hypothetical protein